MAIQLYIDGVLVYTEEGDPPPELTQAWDQTAKNSHAVLSNNDLTVTTDASEDYFSGRAKTAITTGDKKYWEIHYDVSCGSASGFAIGIANASQTWGDGVWLGNAGNNSVGHYRNTQVYQNASVVANYITFTVGDVIGVAVDFTAKKIWWRKNNNWWNNSSTADPATGTEGLDFSAITGDVYPAYGLRNIAGAKDGQTANFGATGFAYAAPSGFTGFDTATTSAGTLAVTLAAATLAGTGTVAQSVRHGTLYKTLNSATLAASGSVSSENLHLGTLNVTLGALTLNGGSKAIITGRLGDYGDRIQVYEDGVLIYDSGGTPLILESVLLSAGAVSNVVYHGTLSATLGALSLAGLGSVVAGGHVGSVHVTLGAMTLAASGTVVNRRTAGTVNVTLGAVRLYGNGTVQDITTTGHLNNVLDNLTLVATGGVPIYSGGALHATLKSAFVLRPINLAPVSLSARGNAFWPLLEGELAATLAPLTLRAASRIIAPSAIANTKFGSKLFICTTPKPVDLTLSDYRALNWVQVKNVGAIGDTGSTAKIETWNELDAEGGSITSKDWAMIDAGNPEIECARNPTDPGQVAMRAAGLTDDYYAFKIETWGGKTTYFNRGLVAGPKRPGGRNEDFVLEVFKLGLVQKEIVFDQ